jgi:hypothetical protein
LAYIANLKDFFSHTACQTLINDLWMGGMKMRKYIVLKVISALLFPPAIFAIEFKTVNELKYMPQTEEEHENDMNDSLTGSQSSLDMQDIQDMVDNTSHFDNKAFETDIDINHVSRPSASFELVRFSFFMSFHVEARESVW